jgi:protein associated with RNAse G/E
VKGGLAMAIKPGDSVSIHAYKHNGNLYRVWEKAIVYQNNKDVLILINEDVLVTELNGRRWKTNEPAVWFFYKNEWFNVISMFKTKGINYYCNLASPFITEDDTVKYIDYDLDVKIFHDNSYKILDLREFNRNRLDWKYPHKIIENVWEGVERIKKMVKGRQGVFDHAYVQEIWNDHIKKTDKPRLNKKK